MAGSIKGITIEIGSNTQPLQKALAGVNKQSKSLQSELKSVERLLKFDPGNTEALAQQQKILSEQISNTTEKLIKLEKAEKQVQEQFANGKISEEQYRAFRREVEFTQGSLEGLYTKLNGLKAEQDQVGESTKQLETLFKATGTSVDDFASSLGDKLTNALKDGKASSAQLEEAIQKIGKEALGANVDIEKLQKALSSVDDGASLKSVNKELGALAQEAKNAEKAAGDLGSALETIAGTAIAGGGIAGAIEKALDVSSLNTKIAISMEVPEESKQSVKDAINDVASYGVDAEAALEGVRRQWALNKDASNESNTAVVQGAATIAAAYSGIDFTELIQETNEISKAMNISNEEALGLTNSLLKMGFPPEQLDIIAEYGTQLQMAGYDAEEIQAIMAAGVETGTWNIDSLLDGLKEGRIVMAEFGQEVPKAMKDLLSGTDISAKQLQEWGKAVAAGGEGGTKAMQDMALALQGVDDKTKQNALGVQLFGTIYEDQGQNILDTLINAKDATVDLKAGQDELNASTAKLNADPAVQMKQAFSDMQTALAPLLTNIAEFVAKVAEWVSENPKIAATITAVVSAVGILIGIMMALAPIFTTISTLAGAMGVGIGALLGPIGLVIAAIVGLVAAGVAIYQNWDEISAKAKELGQTIKEKFEEIKTAISEKIESAKTAAKEKFESMRAEAVQKVAELVIDAANKLLELKTEISTKIENAKTAARDKFDDMKTEAVKKAAELVIDVANKLIDLKTKISEKITDAKTAASTKFGEIKTDLSTKAGEILTAISTKFGEMKSKMTEPFTEAWDTIKEIPGKIKKAFENLSIKIPKPKIPKIDVSFESFGVGDLSVKIPKFKINWHAIGGVFTKPITFGNAGFGDVEEAIVPFEGPHAARIAGLIAKEMVKYTHNSAESIAVNLIMDRERIGRAVAPVVGREITMRVR